MMLVLAVFILGLAAGSFANVCIVRMPQDISVVTPGSRCCSCGRSIAWYDNIPLVSFVLLRARCRACGARFSWQYPVVEFLTGLAFACVAVRFGAHPIMPVLCCVSFALIALSVIDLHHRIIPDVFSLTLVVLGVVTAPFNPLLGEAVPARIIASLVGALTGAVLLLFLGLLGSWLFKKEAMGGGDIKLLAGIGAFLGWERVCGTLFLASLFGAAIGGYLIASGRLERRGYLPFGPFLSLAAYIGIFLPMPTTLLSFLYR